MKISQSTTEQFGGTATPGATAEEVAEGMLQSTGHSNTWPTLFVAMSLTWRGAWRPTCRATSTG